MTISTVQKKKERIEYIMKTFDDSVELIRNFMRINTSNPPGNEEDAVLFLEDVLRREGIGSEIFSAVPRRANILARIKGKEKGRPVILLSHVDVVPVNEAEWTVDPFGAEIKGGYLYGRGAIDMKSQAICQLIAFMALAREGVTPERDIIYLATCDEEVGGSHGVEFMLEKAPELRNASFVLSEGGFMIKEGGHVNAQIAVTEKQLGQFIVRARGRGGHGSMPHGDNANEKIVAASGRILSHKWPMKRTAITSAYLKGTLEGKIMEGSKFPTLDRALKSKKWKSYLESNEIYNAILRNTVTLTILRGGEKVNVIPAGSEAYFDARLLPGESHKNFFKKIGRLAGEDVEIERIGAGIGEPGPSRYGTVYFHGIGKCVRSLKGEDVPILPYIMTGATDLRYFRNLGVPSYGFFPITLNKEELLRMHGKDERISIENIREGLEGCGRILKFLSTLRAG